MQLPSILVLIHPLQGSEWFVVTRVFSEHEVELNIVDFIGSASLESLLDDGVFFLTDTHLEIVEDRAESTEVNEPRSALVFILEVWLDQ